MEHTRRDEGPLLSQSTSHARGAPQAEAFRISGASCLTGQCAPGFAGLSGGLLARAPSGLLEHGAGTAAALALPSPAFPRGLLPKD